MQFGQSLFALMSLEFSPVFKVLVKQGQSLFVVLRESNLFPELFRQMSPLNSFHVEIAMAFVFEHCGVASIGKRAGMARAQTS